MKKIICIILCGAVLLWTLAIGATFELMLEAKDDEFYNSSYSMPAQHENEIVKQYTDGEITFEDLSAAMSQYDMRGLKLPYTCYLRFMDSGGNFISEAGCILKLQIVMESPFKLTNKYISLDKYLSEDFKARRCAGEYPHVRSFELYRENGVYTPVALEVTWFNDGEESDERVVLSNYQPNITCTSDYGVLSWKSGNEEITAEIDDTALHVEKNEVYDYFVAMADGYAQELRKGTTITEGVLGGGGRLDGHAFTEYDYTVLNVRIGPYTYYTFSAVGVNLLEAVFEEPDFVKRLAVITAVFAVIGGAMCGAAVCVFKREN